MRCLKTEKTDPDGTFFEIYPTVRFKAKSGTLFPTQYLMLRPAFQMPPSEQNESGLPGVSSGLIQNFSLALS